MARIRSVKPEFFQSEELSRLSIPARLLYVALWVHADDAGRFRDSPVLVKHAAFPHDEAMTKAEFASYFEELVAAGFVARYDVDGRGYAWIPTFAKHQRPKHPTPSKLPAPPEPARLTDGAAPPAPEATREGTPNPPPVLPQSYPESLHGVVDGEGEGEGEGEQPQTPPTDVTVGPRPSPRRAVAPTLPLALPDATHPPRPRARDRPERSTKRALFPAFTQAHCEQLHAAWRERMGAVDWSRFRKAFGAQYQNAADVAPEAEHVLHFDALDEAFHAVLAVADRGPATSFLTPEKVAQLLLPLARRRAALDDPDRRVEATYEIVHGRRLPSLQKAS